jgi:non-reducing end alpha-L-arabinofuranosidase
MEVNDDRSTMDAPVQAQAAGGGGGPWIMADMENGLFSGPNAGSSNPGDPVIDYRYPTAMVEGESNQWAILGGTPQSGGEGVMASGYPQAATENAVQANIVASGYGAGAGEVHAVGAGKCLDDTGSTTTLGTHQEIWHCTGGANQEWNLNSNGTITGEQSGLCLDVTGKSTANGARVELRTCNGGSNRQWTLG